MLAIGELSGRDTPGTCESQAWRVAAGRAFGECCFGGTAAAFTGPGAEKSRPSAPDPDSGCSTGTDMPLGRAGCGSAGSAGGLVVCGLLLRKRLLAWSDRDVAGARP